MPGFLAALDMMDGRPDGRVFGMSVPGYTGRFDAYQQGFARGAYGGGYGGGYGAPVGYGGMMGGYGGYGGRHFY